MKYTPVIYSAAEKRIISSAKPYTHSMWTSNTFKDIKIHIKNHLENQQHKRCFYCGLPITGISYGRIEHIAPKSRHPEFILVPENLILACEICNNQKGSKETINNPSVSRYPSSGGAFNIVHAYYDIYSAHIRLKHRLFLVGITEKGKRTVVFCQLHRGSLAESRAKLTKRQKLPPTKKLVMILQQTTESMLKRQIMDFIDLRKRARRRNQ